MPSYKQKAETGKWSRQKRAFLREAETTHGLTRDQAEQRWHGFRSYLPRNIRFSDVRPEDWTTTHVPWEVPGHPKVVAARHRSGRIDSLLPVRARRREVDREEDRQLLDWPPVAHWNNTGTGVLDFNDITTEKIWQEDDDLLATAAALEEGEKSAKYRLVQNKSDEGAGPSRPDTSRPAGPDNPDNMAGRSPIRHDVNQPDDMEGVFDQGDGAELQGGQHGAPGGGMTTMDMNNMFFNGYANNTQRPGKWKYETKPQHYQKTFNTGKLTRSSTIHDAESNSLRGLTK